MGEGPGVRAMESGERAGVRADQSAYSSPSPLGERAGVRWISSTRLVQFTKFCIVGGSGVFVDMGVLYLLADPSRLGWNITLSKICAAEIAMVNNFIWNELWTFRSINNSARRRDWISRFIKFNLICSIGIGLAACLLHFFHQSLGVSLYLSNFLAIIMVTFWNFGMNTIFNWNLAPQLQGPARSQP
jgi:dolichol-phosphate mannosyltransferase